MNAKIIWNYSVCQEHVIVCHLCFGLVQNVVYSFLNLSFFIINYFLFQEFKRNEGKSCSGTATQCQNYAGLSCSSGNCRLIYLNLVFLFYFFLIFVFKRCSSNQYWVNNKCRKLFLN